MKLKVKKLRPDAMLPKRMTEYSAGYDLSACLDEPEIIAPGETKLIPTGIAVELECGASDDSGYVMLIYARSSLAVKHGIAPANCTGVVDMDYRGEIFVALRNSSDKPYSISHKERIAQLIVSPVYYPEIEEASDLSDTERGEGGFGSTGRT